MKVVQEVKFSPVVITLESAQEVVEFVKMLDLVDITPRVNYYYQLGGLYNLTTMESVGALTNKLSEKLSPVFLRVEEAFKNDSKLVGGGE